ncbi:hypothetical protein DL764_008370 [Monosporascus ibericus]|uniref:Amino acid permease/ SLC12A domain-containing protein n=1 Tax=Monosporascus ibericus TaxID=155417 RepID=A0A4V1X9A1_9PEZI|nr:hypothetical protein DL764_008370 [Monosporascus ibericus]
MIDVVILISVMSTGTISGYGGSRTTMRLAALGMAPWRFMTADRTGRRAVRCLVHIIICVVLIVVQFFLAVSPLDASSSAEGFFANHVPVILIIVLWLSTRAYYRQKLVVPHEHRRPQRRAPVLRDNDVEKDPAKDFLGKAKKVVGYVFN